MQVQYENVRQVYVEVMDRKEVELDFHVRKTFHAFEGYRRMREPNGIAIGVAIFSPRALERFQEISKKVFPTFISPEPKLQANGEWVWWFSYSEPGIPQHYGSASRELNY
jgi:hypothetical protein